MPGIKKRQSDAATNALVAAAENGDLEELSQLLDAVDPNSQTVVRFRFKSTNIAQIASMLTQSTLPVQSGNTALRAATALGDADCICVLLNRGANIDLETSRGTALLAASSQGDIDILTLLLSRGANIDYETASGAAGFQPAYVESLWGLRDLHQSRTRLIVVSYCLCTGTTALSAAILQHKHAAVELLLAHGAELDHINRDGRTPLQLAQVDTACQLCLHFLHNSCHNSTSSHTPGATTSCAHRCENYALTEMVLIGGLRHAHAGPGSPSPCAACSCMCLA